jgi:16S rRNA (cytosine1402-N4)-methyltransferase
MGYTHTPVMVEEVVRFLKPESGDVVVDATIGAGGHSRAIVKHLGPQGLLIGIDRDPEMAELAARQLRQSGISESRFKISAASFTNIGRELTRLEITKIDGVIFDCGVASAQLDDPGRGFSFAKDGPLDCRFNQGDPVTAEKLVNTLSPGELERIFREYGEERWAAQIARRIIRERKRARIARTLQLADVVKRAIPRGKWPRHHHPATRAFQALRIAVNSELEMLERGISEVLLLLNRSARAVVITYHSLEDRVVKRQFAAAARQCQCPPLQPRCTCGGKARYQILTPKPVTPSEEEIGENPRARSAKLRAIEHIVD